MFRFEFEYIKYQRFSYFFREHFENICTEPYIYVINQMKKLKATK